MVTPEFWRVKKRKNSTAKFGALHYRGFRFKAFWTKIDGFNEVVQQAWTSSVNSLDAILWLHVKMARTAKALKIWSRKTVGNFKVQLAIIQTVLTFLEKAQESRQLSGDELEFRRSQIENPWNSVSSKGKS
jgi:hypothetical protein